MFLIYFITFLAFLQAYDSKIISLIINALNGPQQKKLLTDKIADMTAELSKISMTNEWAKYAKLQRKINAERAALEKIQNDQRKSTLKIKGAATILIKVITALNLMVIAWWYRKHVVASIPPDWIYPVSSYICWSVDVPGGITAPAWIIMSSAAARSISSFL